MSINIGISLPSHNDTAICMETKPNLMVIYPIKPYGGVTEP